jgi:hypothetical protein
MPGVSEGRGDAPSGVTARGLLAGLLVAAVSIAVTLLALEGVARVRLSTSARATLPHVGADSETQRRIEWREQSRDRSESWAIDIPDPWLGWRPKPGIQVRSARPGSFDVTVSVNAQGLRGRAPAAVEKAAGTTRIAIFGCSQTFGSGVEDDETFSALLAASLPGTEVLNFGVHGYGTDQMLLRWELEGRRYSPDLVVLAFAYYHLDRNVTGFRFYAKPRFVLEPDGTLQLAGVPVPRPEALREAAADVPPWPLADHSVLLRWLWDRELRRRNAELYQATGPAWALTAALIRRFAEEVHQAGAQMILLNIDEDAPWMSEPLGRLAHELGIGWADAEAALGRPRSQGIRLRLPDDPHWNARGHAVLAQVLRDAVCRQMPVAGCSAVP